MTAAPLNFRLRHCLVTGSTNDDALAAAAAGETSGLVIYADRQTAGRGRRGRSWVSPDGNLYASVLLQAEDHARAGLYCFVVALALADALGSYVGSERVKLKWPNDVLIDGAKIAGILLETAATETGVAVVAGIGVNLGPYPEDVRYPATSLQALGFAAHRLQILPFLQLVLTAINRYHLMLCDQGFPAIREHWLVRAAGVGEAITVRLPDSELEGRFNSIGDDGCLLLEQQSGKLSSIAVGDVFFQRR
ncbi:MAG: biotin--[acetyl-CoA-carboxylase] ligase [Alphaproteobacteria bacterium]